MLWDAFSVRPPAAQAEEDEFFGILVTPQAIALPENRRPCELREIQRVEHAAEATVHGAANRAAKGRSVLADGLDKCISHAPAEREGIRRWSLLHGIW